MDLLAARFARERAEACERAAQLRALVPAMVAELRARGATRVVLFGSLARGDEPRARTDVDLAVWGLDLGELYGAMDDLGRMTGAKVDLVMGETMGQRLAAAVARDGVEIGDGPG